jgi:hypothetical protein
VSRMFQVIGREIQPGHRAVSASMLPDRVTECPHCGSKNFSLVGSFHRSYEQVFVDGEPKKDGLTLGQIAMQEIDGIVCQVCKIYTIIEDDHVFQYENLICELHIQIASMQGKIVLSDSGKEWKQ